MVRGKPSKRNPLAQSGSTRRSLTRPMMMSSPTSAPESMTCFAARPSGVPALTAVRSMSPVEICGMAKRLQMTAACVPLPAPGAPNKMSLMVGRFSFQAGERSIIGGEAPRPRRERSGKTRTAMRGEDRARSLQIQERVDADARLAFAHMHGDSLAMPEHAQLLETLDRLEQLRVLW